MENDIISCVLDKDISGVQMAIRKGADVNSCDGVGSTALMMASLQGSVDIVKTLLESGADVDMCMSALGNTALMWACMSKHIEIVALLLEYNPDIDAKNSNGNSVFDLSPNPEITNLLLDYKKMREFQKNSGPLMDTVAKMNINDLLDPQTKPMIDSFLENKCLPELFFRLDYDRQSLLLSKYAKEIMANNKAFNEIKDIMIKSHVAQKGNPAAKAASSQTQPNRQKE